MNVILTNVGPTPVPVVDGSTTPEGEQLPILDKGESYELNDPATVVVSVGDNPSILEEMGGAFAGLLAAFAAIAEKLAEWWADIRAKGAEPEGVPDPVRVQIQNLGDNALRVLLGSNLNEVTVDPGAQYTAEASRYVEIRELGV